MTESFRNPLTALVMVYTLAVRKFPISCGFEHRLFKLKIPLKHFLTAAHNKHINKLTPNTIGTFWQAENNTVLFCKASG